MKTLIITLLILKCSFAIAQTDSTTLADQDEKFKKGVNSQFGKRNADSGDKFAKGVRSQFGQDQKSGSKVYGSFYGLIDANAGKPGAGMRIGFAPANYFGFGAGFEGIQMKALNGGNKIGANVFGELRLFVPTKTIQPSLAFQYGAFSYSDAFTLSSGSTISQVNLKGKAMAGGNVNLSFGKNGKGVSVGYSYRSVKFESTSDNTVRYVTNGQFVTSHSTSKTSSTGEYHLITLGWSF